MQGRAKRSRSPYRTNAGNAKVTDGMATKVAREAAGEKEVGRVLQFAAKKPRAVKPMARKPAAVAVAGNLALAATAEPDEAQFSKV